MGSFSIPLTGLEADSTALNTIANDLANMSTTAYKAQTTEFSDLFYQEVGTSGSDDPIQVGAGVKVAANSTDFSNGSISSSGATASDVAIDGDGFFVVSQDGGSDYQLTRAGDFTVDANGDLVTSGGLNVMGYPATDGVVNTSASLTAINIPTNGIMEPSATTTMSMDANLDASATTGSTSDYPVSITTYDSLGEAQVVTVTFEKTGTDTWSYSASTPNSTSAAETGTLTFNSDGTLEEVNGTTVGTGTGDTSSVALSFAGLTDGASNLSINWNLLDSSNNPTITQDSASTSSSSTSTTSSSGSSYSSTSQNGYATGDYESYSVGSDGTIAVKYSNGQTQDVGQIALANVSNEQGLELMGNGVYDTTTASGAASVGISGTNGTGTLEGTALEGSNVSISTEFANLIVAQRAFEANAKSVTTFNTVAGDMIDLIR